MGQDEVKGRARLARGKGRRAGTGGAMTQEEYKEGEFKRKGKKGWKKV